MKRTILALILLVSILTGCGGASMNAGSDWAPQENGMTSGSLGYDKEYYDNGYGWAEDSMVTWSASTNFRSVSFAPQSVEYHV